MTLPLMLVLSGGCLGNSPPPEEEGLELVRVERTDIVRRLRETGSVHPRRSVSLCSRLGGTVLELGGEPGTAVRVGDVLATLEIEPAEHIRYLGTRVTVMQDSIRLAELGEALARKRRDAAKGRASSKEVELAAAELEVQSAKLELSRTQRRVIEKEGGGAERIRQGQADLRAPIDGVVLRRSIEVGEVVRPALSTAGAARELFLLGDLGELIVRSRVDQDDVNQVAPAAAVQVVFDALPGQPFEGLVEFISPASLPTSVAEDRVEYEVRILLIEPGPEIRSGMTCRIDLVLNEAEHVPALPVESLRRRPTGGWEVLLPDGRTTVPVEIGLRNEHWVEIRGGLEVGAEVVRHPVTVGTMDLPDPSLLGRIGNG